MSKDFTKYEVLDLVEDPSFQDYIRKRNTESVQFWEQWITDHPDQAEKIEEATQFLQEIQLIEVDVPEDQTESLLKRINLSIDESPENRSNESVPIRKLSWWKYAVAASIIFIAGLWLFWPSDGMQTYRTDYAMQESIELPDQSRVNLNAGSTLSFNHRKWDTQRQVALAGEAFFEVEKGSSFIVETSLGEVEVLGTSFNVLNRSPYFEVQCITGLVAVRTKAGYSETINPNEAILFNQENNTFEKINLLPSTSGIWTENVVHFVDKPLNYVFEELERQYDIEIRSQDLKGTFNGPLTLNNLEEALYDLCWPMNLQYQIKKDFISITK